MSEFAQVTIGIFGHAGTGNLGDEAIITSTIQNLRARCPDARVLGFTIRPEDTARRHGIVAYPIRHQERGSAQSGPGGNEWVGEYSPSRSQILQARLRRWIKSVPIVHAAARSTRAALATIRQVGLEVGFLRRSFQRLKGVDLLVVAGSGQLNDEWAGGAWGYPYTLFKWTLLARLRGTRIAFVSVGSSELRSWLSRFFIRTALRPAAYRSFRNQGSKLEMARLGLRLGDDPVVPDLVFSLRLPVALEAPGSLGAESGNSGTGGWKVVAINAMPLPDGYSETTTEDPDYLRYLQALTAFSEWLIGRGYAVSYLPTQIFADPPVLLRVREGVRVFAGSGGGGESGSGDGSGIGREGQTPVSSVSTLEELVGELRRADYVVATRFHGVLLSLLLEKPVVAIAYHRKSRELMESVGESDYVVDWRHCSLEALQARFVRLERARAAGATMARGNVEHFRAVLERQYDELAGLVVSDQ